MSTKIRLINYHRDLGRKKLSFLCPDCKIPVVPKEYEKHCTSLHGVNNKTVCVWCRKFSWPRGEKQQFVPHLLECFKKFIVQFRPVKVKRKSACRLLSSIRAYPENDPFNHHLDMQVFSTDPHYRFCPLDIDPRHPVQFRDENVNLAASYVLKYLETRNTHDWIHVMVKSIAFDSFVEVMESNREFCKTLKFSCWCDGGKNHLPQHRQHRHLIVVSYPKGRFKESVWPKVKSPYSFRCKLEKTIGNPLYLVNAMGYLSQRKSRCNFSFDDGRIERDNHFYFYGTLPPHYKLCLVLLWDGGIMQLFYQEYGQNVSIPKLVDGGSLFQVNRGQWRQRLDNFYKLVRGMVLPVEKEFLPSATSTDAYLHLAEGKRLYFVRSDGEILDDETWLQRQVAGGNVFYDSVGEMTWTPRRRDQRILNYYKPLADKVEKLEETVKCQKLENENLKETKQALKLENEKLKETVKFQKLYIEKLKETVNNKTIQIEN